MPSLQWHEKYARKSNEKWRFVFGRVHTHLPLHQIECVLSVGSDTEYFVELRQKHVNVVHVQWKGSYLDFTSPIVRDQVDNVAIDCFQYESHCCLIKASMWRKVCYLMISTRNVFGLLLSLDTSSCSWLETRNV